jgi:hypothetical protein
LYVPPDDKNPKVSNKEGGRRRHSKVRGCGEKGKEKGKEDVVQGVGEPNAT